MRRSNWFLVLIVLAALAAPTGAKAATVGVGIVSTAHYSCAKQYQTFSFSFTGLIPAGKRPVVVTDGYAYDPVGHCSLVAPFPLVMTATNAAGATFSWSCSLRHLELNFYLEPVNNLAIRPTYLFFGVCSTDGRPGEFRLQLLLHAVSGRPNGAGFDYALTGAYVAFGLN